MRPNSPFTYLICVFTFLCLPLHAVIEEEIVEIDFQVVSLEGTIRDLHYLSGEGTKTPLLAFDGSRSFKYNYRGAPVLSLYSNAANTIDGEIPMPVATIDLANAARKNLLLLAPKNDGGYTAVMLPDGANAHPMGSYRFLNLTKSPVAVDANDSKHLLKPKSEYVVQAFPDASTEKTCRIRVAIHRNDSWEMLYTNTWIGSSTERYIAIILETDKGKTIIRRIKEKQASVVEE